MTAIPDDIDELCTRWATFTRRRCGIETPPKQAELDALTTLQGALVKLATATGAPTLGPAAILQGAFDRMPRQLAQLVQLHYLFPSIPVRTKARFFDVSAPTFYARLETGMAYLRGFYGAARLEMREMNAEKKPPSSGLPMA